MKNWNPMETIPQDGRQVLTTDGERYKVLNQPPGCELGDWSIVDGEWRGGVESYFKPKGWREIPE